MGCPGEAAHRWLAGATHRATGRYYLDEEVEARRERHRSLLVGGLMWLLVLALLAYLLISEL